MVCFGRVDAVRAKYSGDPCMLAISDFQDFERVAISRTRCADNTGNVPAIVLTGSPQVSIPHRIGHAAFQIVSDLSRFCNADEIGSATVAIGDGSCLPVGTIENKKPSSRTFALRIRF